MRELPDGDGWQYEPKWDGFRGVLENASGDLRLWSRNARPLLRYFPELQPLGELLPPRSALDGEIVIVRDGVLDFDAMQTRLHPAESRIRRLSGEIPATFVAFDVLAWDGESFAQLTLRERRDSLERLATGFTLSPATLDRDMALQWMDRFETIGLDGVVAKRLDAPYRPGARDAVCKVKPEKTADCVVAGLRWKSRPDRIATLLLGLYGDDGELDYVGTCAVAPARHAEIVGAGPAAAGRRTGTPLLRAEPLGRRRARGVRRATRARRRGAVRQGAGAALPARHEAPPLPSRQGTGAVHVARAPARTTGRRRSRRPAGISLVSLTSCARATAAHAAAHRASWGSSAGTAPRRALHARRARPIRGGRGGR